MSDTGFLILETVSEIIRRFRIWKMPVAFAMSPTILSMILILGYLFVIAEKLSQYKNIRSTCNEVMRFKFGITSDLNTESSYLSRYKEVRYCTDTF